MESSEATFRAILAECLGKSWEMPMSASSGFGSDMMREAVFRPRSEVKFHMCARQMYLLNSPWTRTSDVTG